MNTSPTSLYISLHLHTCTDCTETSFLRKYIFNEVQYEWNNYYRNTCIVPTSIPLIRRIFDFQVSVSLRNCRFQHKSFCFLYGPHRHMISNLTPDLTFSDRSDGIQPQKETFDSNTSKVTHTWEILQVIPGNRLNNFNNLIQKRVPH